MVNMETMFLERIKEAFPDFADSLIDSPETDLEQVRPPATEDDLLKLSAPTKETKRPDVEKPAE